MGRYKSRSIKELVRSEVEGDLYLPVFQRGFKWSRKKQKRLLSSFLVDIPIGAILLLSGEGGEFAKRKLCYREHNRVNEETTCDYLLDGQQRISTLKSIFFDFFKNPDSWKEDEWDNMYPPLQNRWFINLNFKEGNPDIFGIEYMSFEQDSVFKIDSDDIINHIVYKNIYVKDKDKWFNPGFVNENLSDKDQNQVQQRVAEESARNYLVPLYSLLTEYETSNTVHELAVERIAYRRKEQLKAEVKDGDKDPVEVLGPVEGEIEDHIDNERQKEIEIAWGRLEKRWTRRIVNYLESVLENQIPTIELDDDEVDRAVSIFDNMNQGGTPLSTFDLVAARAAQNRPTEESIIDQIRSKLASEVELPSSLTSSLQSPPQAWSPSVMGTLEADDPPSKTTRKYLLNILSTLHYADILDNGVYDLEPVHAKKRKQLEMSSRAINKRIDECISTFSRVMAFLQMRCGITRIGNISYDLMVLPISQSVSIDETWKDSESLDKIEYWYWSSIFSGHYREKQNSRSIDDIPLLLDWINNDIENPFLSRYNSMFEASVYSDKEMLLRTLPEPDQYPVPSAIHDTLLQYVLSLQPKDFLPTEQFENVPRLSSWHFSTGTEIKDINGDNYTLKPEVHHICPLSGATTISQSSDEIRGDNKSVLNSPVLKSIISKTANNIISDLPEDKYFDYLESIAASNHLLPNISEFGQEDGESESEYYLRIAKKRLQNLRNNIEDELDRLS